MKRAFSSQPAYSFDGVKNGLYMLEKFKSDENAMRILSEAGRMYDKFRVFTEQFDKLESQLNTVIKQ